MKSKASKSFVISTADSRYVKPLLQSLIEDHASKGWVETLSKEKFDLKWVSASTEDPEKEKKHMVNRFPGITGLAHKDTYTRIMRIGKEIDSKIFSFVPDQFTFPQEKEKFEEYFKNPAHKNFIYIAKPVASAEGNGIVLFQNLSDIPSMLSQEMVVQRYIHNPLLLDGFKFDLRIYVLVARTNPVQAYVCNEGLARFCTEKYEKPTRENFKKFFMHLTNYSINKHHEDYIESDDILQPNNATKRTLTSLFITLANLGYNTDKIRDNIRATVTRTLSMYGPLIEHGVIVANNLKPINGQFFQVLGFDLLVDENLDAHLLEINDHPSLNIFLEKDYMGGGMGKSLSKIDAHVKKTIIGDALKLTKKLYKSEEEIPVFKSLVKSYPLEGDESFSVSETMNKMRSLYYELAPVKSKLNITSSNFEKILSRSNYVKSTGISNVDLSLLFQRQTQSLKTLEFHDFFWLLLRLKNSLSVKGHDTGESMLEFIGRLVNN